MYYNGMAEFLYVHVPFCIKKCAYCDFYSVSADDRTHAAYVGALKREFTVRRGEVFPKKLKGVYIGGGTPTAMSTALLVETIESVHGNFGIAPDAEITVEANPETLGGDKLRALRGAGVTRLSLGVQSFLDEELHTLGRVHDARKALEAARAAREVFDNLSLDLIYGIPGGSAETWAYTLDTALSLDPAHVSAYELTPEAATPFGRMLDNGGVTLPPEDDVVGMYDMAVEKLLGGGYERYEISNFAKDGRQCAHNVNYWRRGEYVGAGAGAHSFIAGRRFWNAPDLRRYLLAAEAGAPWTAAEGGTEVGAREAFSESVFLGLRTREGVTLEGAPPDWRDRLRGLQRGGFIEIRGPAVRLTHRGILVSNGVIAEVLRRIDTGG
jgi:oxygen-independent coproporphyrinogen-3 oxidase